MPNKFSDLAEFDAFVARSEVVVELAGEYGSRRKRLCALEDPRVGLARVGERFP